MWLLDCLPSHPVVRPDWKLTCFRPAPAVPIGTSKPTVAFRLNRYLNYLLHISKYTLASVLVLLTSSPIHSSLISLATLPFPNLTSFFPKRQPWQFGKKKPFLFREWSSHFSFFTASPAYRVGSIEKIQRTVTERSWNARECSRALWHFLYMLEDDSCYLLLIFGGSQVVRT